MSSPINIAHRITAGLQAIDPPLTLLRVASEATAHGIAEASDRLLQAWAAEVLVAANEMRGEAGQYWASIAAELKSMAWEKCTGDTCKES